MTKDLAKTYALAMYSLSDTDWGRVNRAIIQRWSVAGLIRIKEAADSGVFRGVPLLGDTTGGEE